MLTEYEKKRQETIRNNEEFLKSLQLPIEPVLKPAKRINGKAQKKRIKAGPVRSSSRLSGQGISENSQEQDSDQLPKPSPPKLLEFDEYFDEETRAKALRSDGHFKGFVIINLGWLHPSIVEKYDFKEDKYESLKTVKKRIIALILGPKTKISGWSNAKLEAFYLFEKNPNAYFYRHVEKGEEQWLGDWKPEETELFMSLCREYGCGNKWGIFSSHMKHRVGYQCANYYRLILAKGLIHDPSYKYNEYGEAVYSPKSS